MSSEIVKLSAHDVFAIEQRMAQEREVQRNVEEKKIEPRRRGISDDDLAAAIERQRARTAEEERARKIDPPKQERGRGIGR